MCGRFAFYSPHEAIVGLFHVDEAPQVEPHYNIAPTQYIAAVRRRWPTQAVDAALGSDPVMRTVRVAA